MGSGDGAGGATLLELDTDELDTGIGVVFEDVSTLELGFDFISVDVLACSSGDSLVDSLSVCVSSSDVSSASARSVSYPDGSF